MFQVEYTTNNPYIGSPESYQTGSPCAILLTGAIDGALRQYDKPIDRSSQGTVDEANIKKRSRHPIVILAHGYGGLMYEQALLLSQQGKQDTDFSTDFPADRYQLAFLLGTPHFNAGLGEWAIMEEKWSRKSVKSAATIEAQHNLRQILKDQEKANPIIKIAGYFAIIPDTSSQLMSIS
ncbi:hypothetical protein PGQ11_010220 [Apiospora arundinis]|uniref:Uncharacterized protein n=1 Tax=Apiospora arundinis TaxID=335852 RepID=A0ABR2I970_9PEZI